MKQFSLILSATFLASPSLAEVCDKVSETWRPGDPALDSPLSGPNLVLLAVLLSWALIGIYFRSRPAAVLGLTVGVLLILIACVDRFGQNDILQSAIREGCRSESWAMSLLVPVLWLMTFSGVWIGQKRESRYV